MRSIVIDALGVITGFAMLGLFFSLISFAFWLRFDMPIWEALHG